MSYADIDLAIVPAAPPARKNQRATSWPAPISATVPYHRESRLIRSAFCSVSVPNSTCSMRPIIACGQGLDHELGEMCASPTSDRHVRGLAVRPLPLGAGDPVASVNAEETSPDLPAPTVTVIDCGRGTRRTSASPDRGTQGATHEWQSRPSTGDRRGQGLLGAHGQLRH